MQPATDQPTKLRTLLTWTFTSSWLRTQKGRRVAQSDGPRWVYHPFVTEPETDPGELARRADLVSELLDRIEVSSGDGSATEWWNLSTYEELGGRTPTQAWVLGEHQAVERVVLSWFERSEQVAQRMREDHAFLRMIEERRRALATSHSCRSA
jgi:hypothetical protein